MRFRLICLVPFLSLCHAIAVARSLYVHREDGSGRVQPRDFAASALSLAKSVLMLSDYDYRND